MSTKCVAFANNDIIAWAYNEKLSECVGFDVRRVSADSVDLNDRWRYLLSEHETEDWWEGLEESSAWQKPYFDAVGRPDRSEL